jgi:hypothetical protein
MSDLACRLDRTVDRSVLRGRRRHIEAAAVAQPDVLPERAHRRHDPLPGAAEAE